MPRTILTILTAAFLILAPVAANAQAFGSVSSYEVLKLVDYEQTSSTAPVNPITDGYTIEILIEVPDSPADAITTPPTPSVTTPGTGTAGTVFLGLDGTEWLVEASYGSSGALNAEYGSGNYQFNANFLTAGPQSETLNLSGDFFAVIPEVSSLTNAIWSGGAIVYDIADPFATVGINGSSIPGFGAGTDEVIVSIEQLGGGFDGEVASDTGLASFTIGSGKDFDLAPGTYEVELEYLNAVDDQTGFGDAEGLAGLSVITSFEIEVIPEPSTYGLLIGALALGLAGFFRRR